MRQAVLLIISVASFLVSLAAFFTARSSLKQAEQVAERDRRDWKQRKWFDLYFKASEVYDSLDRFQKQYGMMPSMLWGAPAIQNHFNDLMFLIRKVHSMAVVFPEHRVIKELFDSTAVFEDRNEVLSKDRLKKIFDAVEALRQMALVDTSVLE